jgi:hypothetical protein
MSLKSISIICALLCTILSSAAEAANPNRGKRIIVVDQASYISSQSRITQLKNIYEGQGATTMIIQVDPEKASNKTYFQTIRGQIRQVADQEHVEGVFIIGDVPTGYYYGKPTDLVYRMVHANIALSGAKDIQSVTESVYADIPVGRVTVPEYYPFGGNRQSYRSNRLNNYLDRVISYYKGQYVHPGNKVINYVDSGFGVLSRSLPYSYDLKRYYGAQNVEEFADYDYGYNYDVTNGDTYMDKVVNHGWSLVNLSMHGTPVTQSPHHAEIVDGMVYGSVYGRNINVQDYRDCHHNVKTFVFDSCSVCDWSSDASSNPSKINTEFICGETLVTGKTLNVVSPSNSTAMDRLAAPFHEGLSYGMGHGMALNHAINWLISVEGDYDVMSRPNVFGFQVFGDPWIQSRLMANEVANNEYIIRYAGFDGVAGTVKSIINIIGLPDPFRPQVGRFFDFVFFTYEDSYWAESIKFWNRHYMTKAFAFGEYFWLFNPNLDLTEQNVEGSWGAFFESASYAPLGSKYSVRPVFMDGNYGPFNTPCTVQHVNDDDQYSFCPQALNQPSHPTP